GVVDGEAGYSAVPGAPRRRPRPGQVRADAHHQAPCPREAATHIGGGGGILESESQLPGPSVGESLLHLPADVVERIDGGDADPIESGGDTRLDRTCPEIHPPSVCRRQSRSERINRPWARVAAVGTAPGQPGC